MDTMPVSEGGSRVIALIELLGKSEDLREVRPESSELLKKWGLSIQNGKLHLSSKLENRSWPSTAPLENKTKVTALAVTLKNNDRRLVIIQDIGDSIALKDVVKDSSAGGGLYLAASASLEEGDMQWLAEQVAEVEVVISGVKDGKWSVKQNQTQ